MNGETPPLAASPAPAPGPSALDAIAALVEEVVEAAGFEWRVRRVNSDLVRRCRRVQLLAVGVPSDEDMLAAATVESLPDEQRQAARLRLALDRVTRRLTDETIRAGREADADLLAAGVMAVRIPGGEWEPVRVVGYDEPTDRGASPARISAGDLPADADQVLAKAAWTLSTDGGAAVERLARFRGGP